MSQVPLFGKSEVSSRVVEIVGGGFDLGKFVENFEVLAEAVGGVQALRRLVLDLAVRGLLVAQDRLDTAAASPGKVDGTDQPAKPFVIPERWTWSTIGQICRDSFYGPRFGKAEYVSQGVPTIRTTDMTDSGEIILRDAPKVQVAPEKLALYRVEQDDLLITRTGSIGIMAVFAGDYLAIPSAYLIRFRFRKESVTARFVYSFLKSSFGQEQLGLGSTTMAQPNVNATAIRAISFPIPPLAEQKRIVAKVDQLMALCDDLEARQTKKREVGKRLTKSALEALTTAEGPEEFDVAWKRVVGNFEVIVDRAEKVGELRGVILELAVRGGLVAPIVEDVDALLRRIADDLVSHAKVQHFEPVVEPPHVIPAHWRWVRWGQLTRATSSGWSPQCESRPRIGNEWGVLKVSAVSWDVFKPEENKALPLGVDPRPEFAPKLGDFLMSRANTADLVGRSVVVHEEPNRVFLSDKIIKCDFSQYVSVEYMNFFNRTQTARRHYVLRASGTSDSMKNISRDVILTVPVPLPPLAEQLRIVDKLQRVMQVCDDLEAKLRRAEERAAKLVEAVVRELVA